MARMGVAPEDLVGASVGSSVVPTFAEYVPVVEQAVSVGTRRVYGSYWKRVLEFWGQRRLDEPTASEVKHLAEWVRSQRVLRRNARGGRSAVEHCIAALRCVYRHA
ncbi:integrase, partial [Actinopolyspora erythraea]